MNVHDPADVFWAITTRVNPAKDVIIIPHERIHPLDISVPKVDDAGSTVMRIGGKMAIDATKPPTFRKKERDMFNRVQPSGLNDPAIQSLLQRLAAMSP